MNTNWRIELADSGVVTFQSNTLEATQQLGAVLASSLQSGMLLKLSGTLGAGKTYLVQSIAESLGVPRQHVVSPTFTLVQQYECQPPLVHVDAYRINDEDQYYELGIDEHFEGVAVVLIEWAERFGDLLPKASLDVSIQVLDETKREIVLSCESGRPADLQCLETIRSQLSSLDV